MTTEPALVARGLSKSFAGRIGHRRVEAVRGVDLELGRGEAVALVGPNGAGKTTLLRLLLGLLRPSTGSVRLFGRPAAEPAARAGVGYLAQGFRVHGFLTARQALVQLAMLAGLDRATARRRAPELLDRVGIAGAAGRRAAALSGGEMRRLGLAQALIHRPDLLLLDEPASGLDPQGRRRLATLLDEERSRGVAVLLSSHVLADAERSCERLALLRDGGLILDGAIAALTARTGRWRIAVGGWSRELAAAVAEAGLATPRADDDGGLAVLHCSSAEKQELLGQLLAAGAQIESVERCRRQLEEVVLEHLGEPLTSSSGPARETVDA